MLWAMYVNEVPSEGSLRRSNKATTVVDIYAPGTDIAVPGSSLTMSGTSFGKLVILFLI